MGLRILLLIVVIFSVLIMSCFAILNHILSEPERYDAGINKIMLEVSNQYTYSLPNSDYSQQAHAYRLGGVKLANDSVDR